MDKAFPQKQFRLPKSITVLPHRDRIMAKRKLYAAPAYSLEPAQGDFFRKRMNLPHQGQRECGRRAAFPKMAAA